MTEFGYIDFGDGLREMKKEELSYILFHEIHKGVAFFQDCPYCRRDSNDHHTEDRGTQENHL